jgi:putative membrane protein
MKNIFIVCYTLPFLFLLWSCNNRSSDSEKKAKAANSAKIDSQIMTSRSPDAVTAVPSKADADFLVEAASGGMTEVQLGQLAQTHSMNQQVKAFGALMIKDHGAAGEKLKALAASKNITLPDAGSNQQQKIKERLEMKKGEAFDRAYISIMIDDHKKDIREFKRAAKNAADLEIRAFAVDNLPVLSAHLDSAQSLEKKMGIPVGPPPYQ